MLSQPIVFDQKQKDDAVVFLSRVLIDVGRYLKSAIRYANEKNAVSSEEFWHIITIEFSPGKQLYRPTPAEEKEIPIDPYARLDTQVCLKYLAFAETDGGAYVAQRSAYFKMAGIEKVSGKYTRYLNCLHDMIGFRNRYAHITDDNLKNIDNIALHRVLKSVRELLSVLSGTPWDQTNSQPVLNYCRQKEQECILNFQAEPISVKTLSERVSWRLGGEKECYTAPISEAVEYCNFSIDNDIIYGVESIDILMEKLWMAPSLKSLTENQRLVPMQSQHRQPIYTGRRYSPAQRRTMVTADAIMPPNQKNLMFLLTEFTCVLDESMLLSPLSYNFFITHLLPALNKWKTHLCADESVVASLFALYRSTVPYSDLELAHLDADEASTAVAARKKIHTDAKRAIKLLRHLREQGCLQVMSSLLPAKDSRENLMEMLGQYTDQPILLLTMDRQLVSEIAQRNLQQVLVCKPTLDEEFFFYLDTQRNFMRSHANQVDDTAGLAVDYPIPVRGESILCGDSKEYLTLRKSIGDGGEGVIYETTNPDMVAKIYFNKNCTGARREKLEYMIAHNPSIEGLAWPSALVYDLSGVWVGFLMPRVAGTPLALTVFHPGRNCANITHMGWHRQHLAQAAANVAAIFGQLHNNDILMGDINPRNILVSSDCAIGLVDCDSYQIGDYDCPVGTPLYTPPEVHREMRALGMMDYGYHRSIEHEHYSLAVLLFEIVMMGKAPYESSNNDIADVVDAIIAGHFPYRHGDDDSQTERFNIRTPVGKWRNIWSHMPYQRKEDFHQVFIGKNRPSAQQWQENMSEYAAMISKGHSSNELLPSRYKVLHNNNWGNYTEMIDLICSDCKTPFNLGVDVYQNRKRHKETVLCEPCRDVRKNLSRREVHVSCQQCGTQFLKQPQQCIELARRRERILCDSCRTRYGTKFHPIK